VDDIFIYVHKQQFFGLEISVHAKELALQLIINATNNKLIFDGLTKPSNISIFWTVSQPHKHSSIYRLLC
jgi:hypothetical protein